jgi:pimeloyl-ACP methyl ester carboxylesterase
VINPFAAFRIGLRRAVLGLAALMILGIALGSLYQGASLLRERRAHPMPGQLVDVGGYKMHIYCTGQGSPAVVLDSGLGDSFISWEDVQPGIAKFVRVCSYDRAGMGYSQSSPRPRNSAVFAEELHKLLQNARIESPYILVGHSMGAYDIRLYASQFKDEVAGIVFVDGCHPDQLQRFPAGLNAMNPGWIREGELLEFTTPFGIPRLLGYCGNDAALRATECTFNDARENAIERMTFRENAALAKGTTLSSGLPVIVLSHDPTLHDSSLPPDVDRETNSAWEKMQEELNHLSTNSELIVAKRSGHYIQHDRPDIVVGGIRQIVDRVRQRRDENASGDGFGRRLTPDP